MIGGVACAESVPNVMDYNLRLLAAFGLSPSLGTQGETLARAEAYPALFCNTLSDARGLLERAHLDEAANQVLSWLPTAGGEALDPAMRADLEAVLKVGLEDVRVFHGSAAARACDELGAHAFAIGTRIYFGSGEWAPGSQPSSTYCSTSAST